MIADLKGQPIDLGNSVTLTDIWAIAVDHRAVEIGAASRDRMALSTACLARMVSERRRIYGVTTGYGPLADNYVIPEMGRSLQRNLIYHLATGVGEPLSPSHTRAIIATRLRSLAIGHSAIGDTVVALLAQFLNQDILPMIPEMGTVGASGDLTPLAHLALGLMGEGRVSYRGRDVSALEALASASLNPVTLDNKDGIALVNGTAAMTGISAINGVAARRATDLGLRLALLYAEIMGGHAEAYDPRLGSVRPHAGQIAAHDAIIRLARGSSRLKAAVQPPPILESTGVKDGVLNARALPQDPYSIRCLPQIFGAIYDLLSFHDGIVETELNSVNDNPIVFAADDAVLHGGNFYGQHVSFAADTLALAVIKLAIHAERCIARITDPALNRGLPAFLHGDILGLNSGLMGAQVTASALVAEMRTKANPASIQSIPTNANNQDVVTMCTIAARKTNELLELAWHVLSIHAIAMTQAFELTGGFRANSGFSEASKELAARVREQVAFLDADRPLANDIATLAYYLIHQDWTIELC